MSGKPVYLSLGTNIGERTTNLRNACSALEEAHIHIFSRSSVYETEPRDFRDQPWFLNMVVACETRLFPLQLLHVLQRLERKLGRLRSKQIQAKGPRVIDLDILLYRSSTIMTPRLQIPHASLVERRFVLEPLLEIAPALRHPVTGLPLASYLSGVSSQLVARKMPAAILDSV